MDLEGVYLMGDDQVRMILEDRGYPTDDPLLARMIVTIIYANEKRIGASELKYIDDPDFQNLYAMEDSELADLVVEYDLDVSVNPDRFEILRAFINAKTTGLRRVEETNSEDSGASSTVSSRESSRASSAASSRPSSAASSRESSRSSSAEDLSTPSTGALAAGPVPSATHPAIEQAQAPRPEKVGKRKLAYLSPREGFIFVCGDTYDIKDQIKEAGGMWTTGEKCWKFPLRAKSRVEKLLSRYVTIVSEDHYEAEIRQRELEKLKRQQDDRRREKSSKVKVVSKLPASLKGLGLYRLNDSTTQLRLCGSGTYSVKDRLLELSGKWTPEFKCWSFSIDKERALIDLVAEGDNQDEPGKKTSKTNKASKTEKKEPRVRQTERGLKDAVPIGPRVDPPQPEIEDALDPLMDGDVLDISAARKKYQGQIQSLEVRESLGNKTAIVTYTGDRKPPDRVLAAFVDQWVDPILGFEVKPLGNRKHRVNVFLD